MRSKQLGKILHSILLDPSSFSLMPREHFAFRHYLNNWLYVLERDTNILIYASHKKCRMQLIGKKVNLRGSQLTPLQHPELQKNRHKMYLHEFACANLLIFITLTKTTTGWLEVWSVSWWFSHSQSKFWREMRTVAESRLLLLECLMLRMATTQGQEQQEVKSQSTDFPSPLPEPEPCGDRDDHKHDYGADDDYLCCLQAW